MVNFIADNKSSLESSNALHRVKNFFNAKLVNFNLISEVDYGNQYDGFCIVYNNGKINVTFRSSWQGLDYEILMNGATIMLSDFDSEFRNIIACSESNLDFTLSVFKRFVDEKSIT